MKSTKKGGLVLTAPQAAVCGLYSGMPESSVYKNAVNPEKAIAPDEIGEENGIAFYRYEALEAGLYYCAASLEGHTSVCQIIRYTEEKAKAGMEVNFELTPLAGTGYEKDYIMLNTREFIEAQLLSRPDAWGEEYEHLFRTPQFTRPKDHVGRHQQTTNEEIWEFVRRLAQENENVYLFNLGKTPKYGFEMPLVLFTRENVKGMNLEEAAEKIRNNGKPTVQYTAQVHSNEPASSEGALAMMLDLVHDHGKDLLDALDVYIIPRINMDGAVEVIRTAPATGDDMNRDYLYMNNREIRMIVSAYNLFRPEAVVDGHEKRTNFLTADEARCTDMELQIGTGSLNHPEAMAKLGLKMALTAYSKARSLGLRSHFYDSLAIGAGGSAGSSYFGVRNSLSFLVETPGGTTLGMLCMERRVLAQYVLASTILRYTAENSQEVMNTVHSSRREMIARGAVYREEDLFVLEHERAFTGSLAIPIIHVPSGEVVDPARETPYQEHVVALHTRPRPTAYLIPKGLAEEKEIFRVMDCHAIPHESLPAGSRVMLKQYRKAEVDFEVSEEKEVCFEQGAYVFYNTVPSAVLSVIMEPDFNSATTRKMTLYRMGLVALDEEGFLPLYRYCRDLKEGKLEATF